VALRRCPVTLRLVHVVRRPAHRPAPSPSSTSRARPNRLLGEVPALPLRFSNSNETQMARYTAQKTPPFRSAFGSRGPWAVRFRRFMPTVSLRRFHRGAATTHQFALSSRSTDHQGRARPVCDPSGRRGCLRAHPVLSSAAVLSETQRMKRGLFAWFRSDSTIRCVLWGFFYQEWCFLLTFNPIRATRKAALLGPYRAL
jgi:hypothetical protein